MTTNLRLDNLLLYSESSNKYFHAEFKDKVNIIYGRNTSGKSTLFLSILYTFGINDGNHYLTEVLNEKIISRVDCSITRNNLVEKISFVRDDETLFVKRQNMPIQRFNGIKANNSAEHVKLKNYIADVLGFNLNLESKNEYKQAPIETMFLPYYVSQTVGWVYLRKSFSSLEFYKNFKEDYLDYYLGLDPSVDRLKRHELQTKLKKLQEQISLISRFEIKNDEIQLTKLTDEKFIATSNEYIERYSKNHSTLTENENEYVIRCNELSFLQERKTTLQKVKSGHSKQKPELDNCPTCSQSLPFGISETYKYLQEENDTAGELAVIKAKIKDTQAKINSLQKTISESREQIAKDYQVLKKYTDSQINYDTWLNNKANTELINKLNEKLGSLTVEKSETEEELKKYKTEEEIEILRNKQSNAFTAIFENYLRELGVKAFEEDRYLKLYQISAFPSQGVELHKTIMAYHFAFNKLISETDGIHRFPFMLDAIFKEDLEDHNKKLILKFINKNQPTDTQTLISIAEVKGQQNNVPLYNKDHFTNGANLIQIGESQAERSLLTEYKGQVPELLADTLAIMDGSL